MTDFLSAEITIMNGNDMEMATTSDIYDFVARNNLRIVGQASGQFKGYPKINGYIGPLGTGPRGEFGARYETEEVFKILMS